VQDQAGKTKIEKFMTTSDLIKNVSKTLPQGKPLVLVFQGGGALGAYQWGVYQALTECQVHPHWVIGTSIGAINAGLIAGNPPEKRMAALTDFWDLMESHGRRYFGTSKEAFNFWTFSNGIRGFFTPNVLAWMNPYRKVGIEWASYYSTEPLKETLSALIDLDYLNSKKVRLTVGAVNANTGEMRYFDNRDEVITIDHIMASGALPPAFPAIRIDGQPYWDGAIYSNSPIEAVLDDKPRLSSIIFSVHLWNPVSDEPENLKTVFTKYKDIQFASRDHYIDKEKKLHLLRHVIRLIGDKIPAQFKKDKELRDLIDWGCATTMHVIKLVAPRLEDEDQNKDIDFTSEGINARKAAGYHQTLNALIQQPWNNEVDPIDGVLVHEFK
jgi:NTE family protein